MTHPKEKKMAIEPTYLHTWGSRRHIAADHDGTSGTALCGQQGYTEAGRFRNYAPSPRVKRTILHRPICDRCAELAGAPVPTPVGLGEALAWLMANSDGVVGLKLDGTVMPWPEVQKLYLGFASEARP